MTAMTVRELIAELQTKDPETPVYRYVGGEAGAEPVICTEEIQTDNGEAGVLLN